MMSKVTRRQLAAVLAAPTLLAQTPQPAAADDDKAALDQLHHNAELLAKVDVPQDIEPAVHFKA